MQFKDDIELCDWPGYSADFNAIELVWNIIKQEVKTKNPKSQSELENAVGEACSSLSLNVVRSCIPKRLKQFIYMLYLHINLLLPFCTASFALSEYIQENSFWLYFEYFR